MIAFGPYFRTGNPEAARIHQAYVADSCNQRNFIKSARQFLIEQERKAKELESKPSINDEKTNEEDTLSNNYSATEETPKSRANSYSNNALPSDNKVIAPKKMNGITEPVSASLTPPPHLHTLEQHESIDHVQNSMQSISVVDGNNDSRTSPGIRPPSPISDVAQVSKNSVTPNLSFILPPGPPPGMPPPFRTSSASVTDKTTAVPPDNLSIHESPPATESKSAPEAAPITTPAKPAKIRRTQTRYEEQPGRLFANDIPPAALKATASYSHNASILSVRPRSELTARWILPLSSLRDRALRRFEEEKSLTQSESPGHLPPSTQNLTIREALKYLAVGLFRRGASENGSQSSIVSKEILGSEIGGEIGRPAEDYPFGIDQRTDSVFGTVPFYAPRTPGNVVFRLYFEDEPHVTLATGPCVHIVPTEDDYDSVLRFILSNFKSKKSVGVSSMNSLASALELFSPNTISGQYSKNYFDGAGRMAWGCICESRKVVEFAASTYIKKKKQLEEQTLEDKNDEKLPLVHSTGGTESVGSETHETNEDGPDKNVSNDGRAKMALEEYNNERKWKEIQLVYASVLKVGITRSSLYFCWR